jgi:hypothetical protein
LLQNLNTLISPNELKTDTHTKKQVIVYGSFIENCPNLKPGMVVYIHNPSTYKAEAGGARV